jgi:hypothetical protein
MTDQLVGIITVTEAIMASGNQEPCAINLVIDMACISHGHRLAARHHTELCSRAMIFTLTPGTASPEVMSMATATTLPPSPDPYIIPTLETVKRVMARPSFSCAAVSVPFLKASRASTATPVSCKASFKSSSALAVFVVVLWPPKRINT